MSKIPLKLGGKVALITGAGSGIGAATAKLFTQLGATIAITGTTKSKLENTAKECQQVSVGQPQPLIIVGNVKDSDALQKCIDDTLKNFGKLDTLVNNAGTYKNTALLLEGSIADFDELLAVNLRSLIVLTQLAAPHLIKTKGSIINTSSVAGKHVVLFIVFLQGFGVFYSMLKGALDHFTKHAAREFGQHQVRVNSVSPGVIKTDIFAAMGLKPDEVTEFYKTYSKMHVLGRVGESPEVAKAIAFLASDDASFITGADILVDGGLMVNQMTPPATSKE